MKIGVIIISISENKCCNHDTIVTTPIFKMAAAAILYFEKKAIVGAWHHPDLISRGSEDSKTVLTSNTCFFKGVKLGFLLRVLWSPSPCLNKMMFEPIVANLILVTGTDRPIGLQFSTVS